MQDGTAILWREKRRDFGGDHSAAAVAPYNATAPHVGPPSTPTTPTTTTTTTIPTPTQATAATPALTTLRQRRPGQQQLVPVATLRGHSGASVWRLAVHDFPPHSAAISDFGGGSSAGAIAGRGSGHESGRALTLLATGGNDAACKLWDLGFEASCEKGGIRWGVSTI